jgi:hypothetical protein
MIIADITGITLFIGKVLETLSQHARVLAIAAHPPRKSQIVRWCQKVSNEVVEFPVCHVRSCSLETKFWPEMNALPVLQLSNRIFKALAVAKEKPHIRSAVAAPLAIWHGFEKCGKIIGKPTRGGARGLACPGLQISRPSGLSVCGFCLRSEAAGRQDGAASRRQFLYF